MNFDSENTFFQFRTHYFWRSKRHLKYHSMACKHYYALFGSKWSYSTQKNQNSFFNGQVIVQDLAHIVMWGYLQNFLNSKNNISIVHSLWIIYCMLCFLEKMCIFRLVYLLFFRKQKKTYYISIFHIWHCHYDFLLVLKNAFRRIHIVF